jgi:hypothetical protein
MRPKTIEELEEKHSKEIADIRHNVNSMRQEFKNLMILYQEVQTKRAEQDHNIDRLLRLLEGDPIDPKRGLVNRIILMEDFILSMKNLRSYLMGNIAAVIFVIGFIGGVIAFIYKAYEFFANK